MSHQDITYNLTENVADGKKFDLRGRVYFLRYPLVSEVETIQDLSQGLDDAESLRKEDPEAYKAKAAELEDFLYGLIEPIDHEVNIRDALQKENVKVYRNFNTMIKTELSLQGLPPQRYFQFKGTAVMNPDVNAPLEGKRIKMQSVVKATRKKFVAEELYAQVCYHYPQYTMNDAAKLSYHRIKLLLKVAAQQKAVEYYNLTQIAAAPHTKKGEGVKKLSEHFKKTANS